jgi:hypothetical protein
MSSETSPREAELKQQLEALRALSDRATAGPWKATALPGGWDGVKSERWNMEICALRENTPVNAVFIAAAVNYARAALAAADGSTER